jgi:uncharacterized protein (DUF1778 family)
MLRIYGLPVEDADVEWLVDVLRLERTLARRHAANMISQASAAGGGIVALTPEDRSAIIAVLEDPPEGLAALRGWLERDHAYRFGGQRADPTAMRNVLGVIALYGIPIAEEDARTLIDLLLRGDTADGLVAAEAIERGLALEAKLLALTPAMRDAILSVLEDPPEGLAELQGKLDRDQRDRSA